MLYNKMKRWSIFLIPSYWRVWLSHYNRIEISGKRTFFSCQKTTFKKNIGTKTEYKASIIRPWTARLLASNAYLAKSIIETAMDQANHMHGWQSVFQTVNFSVSIYCRNFTAVISESNLITKWKEPLICWSYAAFL